MDQPRGTPQDQRGPALVAQQGGPNESMAGASEGSPEAFPGRYSSHAHGAVASHFQAYGGETWMDFLRESGTDSVHPQHLQTNPATTSDARAQPSSSSRFTLPDRPLPADRALPRTDSSSSRSSDRKRRLTTADTPMRRPSSIRMHSTNTGATSTDPIILGSSPAPLPPPQPPRPTFASQSITGSGRRVSDLVLPPWQPDTEVSQCPVCSRHFTFLYRKHHCRKCGRVVCAACSPHRITIPRQFIVHPPYDNTSNIIDLTGDDDGSAMSSFGPFRNPALGGGEEVRVCNPCVPDPNFGPPPQYTPAGPSRYPPRTSSRTNYTPPPQPPTRHHRPAVSIHEAAQIVQAQRSRELPNLPSDNRRVSYHGDSTAERWRHPLPSYTALHGSQAYSHENTNARVFINNGQMPLNLRPSSRNDGVMYPGAMYTPIPAPQQSQQQPPRPRRQIAEEDECPICGNELPPKEEDDESARVQHIEECIALHSASPAPIALTQQTSASLPNQRTRGMSNVGNGEGASNLNRMSHAARGMFPYVATEKDCIDDDGREAECIICLEDFEAGDKMARLVCWCKFHEKCIREWWDKKGRGACPTHQLQE